MHFVCMGVSMTDCITKARKKVPNFDSITKTALPVEEWGRRVSKEADEIFASARAKQISPSFDAPQFCRDWIEIGLKSNHIRSQKIMARGIKIDAKGDTVIRKGAPVMTWLPYSEKTKQQEGSLL